MNLKQLLRLVLGVLLPVAYVALKKLYPDFPLMQDSFMALIFWVLGLLIGGWNLKSFIEELKGKGKV